MATFSDIIDKIDLWIVTNGLKEINAVKLNDILKQILNNPSPRRKRIVLSTENLIIDAETEQMFSQDLYNKGTITINTLSPSDYGTGLVVSRDGILRVDGLLVNENLIINNGLIIT